MNEVHPRIRAWRSTVPIAVKLATVGICCILTSGCELYCWLTVFAARGGRQSDETSTRNAVFHQSLFNACDELTDCAKGNTDCPCEKKHLFSGDRSRLSCFDERSDSSVDSDLDGSGRENKPRAGSIAGISEELLPLGSQVVAPAFALVEARQPREQAAALNGAFTPARGLTFNGTVLTQQQQTRLEQIEREYAFHLPDGGYWYDTRSGAFGRWSGPTEGRFPSGLELGGAMPADCSGGGSGVFVNGRELHPLETAALDIFLPLSPGRYWLDADGNGGNEGSPVARFNLLTRALETLAGSRHRQGSSRAQRVPGAAAASAREPGCLRRRLLATAADRLPPHDRG